MLRSENVIIDVERVEHEYVNTVNKRVSIREETGIRCYARK